MKPRNRINSSGNGNSSKETLKIAGEFKHFIENKLSAAEEVRPTTNYQKTLFSSPHFKDQDNSSPRESQKL
jgi:hypothetical protein